MTTMVARKNRQALVTAELEKAVPTIFSVLLKKDLPCNFSVVSTHEHNLSDHELVKLKLEIFKIMQSFLDILSLRTY
jgi:hypothetical protein